MDEMIKQLLRTTDRFGDLMPCLVGTPTAEEAKRLGLVEDYEHESVRGHYQRLTAEGMRQKNHVDVFAKVPEFLAAFNNILKNGYFEDIEFKARTDHKGNVSFCLISISGFIPSEEKYNAKGCGAIIDPDAIIGQCRKLCEQNEVKNLTTKVETEDWPLWDEEGEHIIGSKGQKTKIILTILFVT